MLKVRSAHQCVLLGSRLHTRGQASGGGGGGPPSIGTGTHLGAPGAGLPGLQHLRSAGHELAHALPYLVSATATHPHPDNSGGKHLHSRDVQASAAEAFRLCTCVGHCAVLGTVLALCAASIRACGTHSYVAATLHNWAGATGSSRRALPSDRPPPALRGGAAGCRALRVPLPFTAEASAQSHAGQLLAVLGATKTRSQSPHPTPLPASCTPPTPLVPPPSTCSQSAGWWSTS